MIINLIAALIAKEKTKPDTFYSLGEDGNPVEVRGCAA